MMLDHGKAEPLDYSNLQNFIFNVDITRVKDGTKVEAGNDEVLEGDELKIIMKFKEDSAKQMIAHEETDSEYQLWYQLPDVFVVNKAINHAPILVEVTEKVNNTTVRKYIQVGSYSIDENGLITVSFDKVYIKQESTTYTVTYPDSYYFDNYTNVVLAIEANVSVIKSEQGNEINFGNEIIKSVDVKIPDVVLPPSITVNKTGSYDVQSERITYTIEIKALDDIKNIVLHDMAILGNQTILSSVYNSLYSSVKWYSNDTSWGITMDTPQSISRIDWDSDGNYADFSIFNRTAGSGDSWELSFGDKTLSQGRSIIIEYTIDLTDYYDAQNWPPEVRWNGSYTNIYNYVIVDATNLENESVKPGYDIDQLWIDKTQLYKKADRVYFNADHERSIDWTFNYGISQWNGYYDPRGAVITDTLDDIMFIRNRVTDGSTAIISEGSSVRVSLYFHGKAAVAFTFVADEQGNALYIPDGSYDNLGPGMLEFSADGSGFTLHVPEGDDPWTYYVRVELFNVGIRDITDTTTLHNQVLVEDGVSKEYNAYIEVGPDIYHEVLQKDVPVSKTGEVTAESFKYEITFNVSSEFEGRSFSVQDHMFLGKLTDTTTKHLQAISQLQVSSKDFVNVQLYLDGVAQTQSATDFSQNPVIFGESPLNYQIDSSSNYLVIRFGGADNEINSKWPLGLLNGEQHEYEVTITYEIKADAEASVTYGKVNQIKLSDYFSQDPNNSINNEVTVIHEGIHDKAPIVILQRSYVHKEGKIENINNDTYFDYTVSVPKELLDTDPITKTDTTVLPSLTSLKLIDQFDPRLEYVPKSLYVKCKDSAGNVFYFAAVTTTKPGVSTLVSDPAINEVIDTSTSGEISISFHRLNEIEFNGDMNQARIVNNLTDENYLSYFSEFEIHYRLRLKDHTQPDTNGRYSLKNTARILCGQYEFSDDTTLDYMPKDRLSKTYLGGDDNRVTYKIEINPEKKTLHKSDGLVLLSDRMVDSLLFYSASFCLMEEREGEFEVVELTRVSGVPTGVYEYSINTTHTSNDTLLLLVPDETHLIFTYDARVFGPPGDNVTLINYASLGDIQRKTSINLYKVQESSANAAASEVSFELLKHDRDFSAEVLQGATFALYADFPYYGSAQVQPPLKEDGSNEFVVDPTFTIQDKNGLDVSTFYYIGSFTTGVDGIARISNPWLAAEHDFVYALVEYEAPEGYVQPSGNYGDEFTTLFKLNPLTNEQKLTLMDFASQTQVVTDFIMVSNYKPIQKEVRIIKADQETEQVLEGARFAFYTDKEPNPLITPPTVDPPNVTIEASFMLGSRTLYYAGETTTNEKGFGTIQIATDQSGVGIPNTINPDDKAIYALVEIATPRGYITNSYTYENPILMCFDPKMQTNATDVSRVSVLNEITSATNRNDYAGSVGYSFIPNKDIIVDQVGRPDNASNGGTTEDHTIKIWEETGTNAGILLATATVGPTSPIVDSYRVATLNHMIVLEAGKTYIIVSDEYKGTTHDKWYDFAPLPVNNELITVVYGRFTLENDYGFPVNSHGKGQGYAGLTFFENKTTNRTVSIDLLEGILINGKAVDPSAVYNFTVNNSDEDFAHYTVTNSYEYKPMIGELKASKIVLGRPAFDSTFTFILTELNSEDITDVKNNGIKLCKSVVLTSEQKEVVFSFTNNEGVEEIPPLRVGTHFFSLKESLGPEDEWTFDKTVRLIKIEVTDTTSDRVFTATFMDNSPNSSYDVSQFVNQYKGNNTWQDFAFPETGSRLSRVPLMLGSALGIIIIIGIVVYRKRMRYIE